MKKKKDMMEEGQNTQNEQTAGQQQEVAEPAGELKEETLPESATPGKNEEGEEAKDPVDALQEELAAQKDKYLRLMAEFDNYKRRSIKEYDRLVESANERLMLDIIEVREGFERALGTTH
jgi:molecular chaperone GrpE